jgi:hypothetical protein
MNVEKYRVEENDNFDLAAYGNSDKKKSEILAKNKKSFKSKSHQFLLLLSFKKLLLIRKKDSLFKHQLNISNQKEMSIFLIYL